MVLGLGLLAVSAVLLIAGAELFAENAAATARGMRITVFGAAFLLAGAEPEEMITAAIASGRHHPGLAAGDPVAANLTMLTLVLGLAALARPLPFGGRVRTYAASSALAGGLAALLGAPGPHRPRAGRALAAPPPCRGGAGSARAGLGVAALVRPLAVTGVLAPAVAAAALPIAPIAIQARPDLTEPPNLRDLAQNLRPRRMGTHCHGHRARHGMPDIGI